MRKQAQFRPPMKTWKEWGIRDQFFQAYVNEGDEIDKKIFNHFLGVVPPIHPGNQCMLCGEPFSHTKENIPTFMVFRWEKTKNRKTMRYFYRGILTIKQALALQDII